MAISPEFLMSCLLSDLRGAGLPTQGGMWPGISRVEAAALAISESLLKKFDRGQTAESDAAATDKFIACNQACDKWELPVNYDSKTEILLNELKRVVDRFWHRKGYPLFDHPFQILDEARIGPGVNLEACGEDFYTKFFSSRLSCSDPSLYNWYRSYTKRFPEWSNAELIRLQTYGEPSIRLSNRLSHVPKNDKISRCICVEPTLNTYFQLGIGRIFELRLKEQFGIDLKDQQFKNRDLARLGSITDGLSTIDLSSASDSISTKMLRWLLPKDMYIQLMKYRCNSVDIKGRGTEPLHMVSTMGNGYTFPLQTMLFASVVVACLTFRGIPLTQDRSDRLWGVFGDDIICPRSVTEDVIYLLSLLGFSVNHDKTFVEGPFRESCGADFFQGSDIRGVYVKTLKTPASRYAVINLLVRFSTKTGIYLPKTISALLKTVRFLAVPRWEDISSGIHTPSDHSHVRNLPKATSIFGKRYRLLVAKAVYWRVSEQDRIVVPRGYKQRIYNPSGLLISFLQGTVKSSKVSVRSKADVLWRIRRRETSLWDSSPLSVRDHFDFDTDWQRWEIAAHTYFKIGV